jgi:hypothetical protein
MKPQLVAGAELKVTAFATADGISCEIKASVIKRKKRLRMEFMLAL